MWFGFKRRPNGSKLIQLRERVAVLELKKIGEERDKRRWQFVYIGFGTALALAGGIVTQFVMYVLKK